MTITEAQKLLAGISTDERFDLLMFLAEQFGCRVINNGHDITHFLPTKEAPPFRPRFVRYRSETEQRQRNNDDNPEGR